MAIVKCNPNAELRVITSLLMLGDYKSIQAKKAMIRLDDDCFYNEYNRDFFIIIKKRYGEQLPFDDIIFMDLIKPLSKDHYNHYMNTIYGSMRSTANFEAYIDELVISRRLRKQIAYASNMLANCRAARTNQESEEFLQQGIGEIVGATLNNQKTGSTLAEIGERYFDGSYDGEIIKTNVDEFDLALGGGLQNSAMITVCGDTGVGKTYFALYLMHKISNFTTEKQSLYFNLEMKENKTWERLVGIVGKKPFFTMSTQERIKAHTKANIHPTTIYEEKNSDIDDIIAICRVKAMEKPISVIVVDYITLVTCKNDYHRNDLEQTSIAKRLASLAIELQCIVIATSQTNRNPEKRPIDDRCPYKTDASDSSGNYKSAELWIGIDRPELYNDDPYFKNKFIAKARKNRNGSLFSLVWDFNAGTFGERNDSKEFFRQIITQSNVAAARAANIFGGY